jgi:hypothetical protein
VTILPKTRSEFFDEMAELVKKGKGKWVLVGYESRHSMGQKYKVALERRGLNVEVTERIGHDTEERPWEGWRTWARTI